MKPKLIFWTIAVTLIAYVAGTVCSANFIPFQWSADTRAGVVITWAVVLFLLCLGSMINESNEEK